MNPEFPEPITYPATPPDCLILESETFGQTCEACPLAPACGYLAVSQELVRTSNELTYMEQSANERRLDNMVEGNKDELLPGFYNSKAIKAMIEKDPSLAQELLQGRAALVMIDVRGLHAVNEKYGNDSGDEHLVDSAERLSNSAEGVRMRLKAPKHAHRREAEIESEDQSSAERSFEIKPDIGIRVGKADEMYVLLRDITPDDLPKVVKRLEKIFSVNQAIRDARKGRRPIPATVSSAHCAEIPLNEDYTADDVFDLTFKAVKQRHDSLKPGQYAAMWQKVCDKTDRPDRHVPQDARMIYDEFIIHCCNDFVRIMASRQTQNS